MQLLPRPRSASPGIFCRALFLCFVLSGAALSAPAKEANERAPKAAEPTTEPTAAPATADEAEAAADALDGLPPAPETAPATQTSAAPAQFSPVKPASQTAATTAPNTGPGRATAPTLPTLPPVEWRILDEPAKVPGRSQPAPATDPMDADPGTALEKPPITTESLRSIVNRRNLALPLAAARIEIDKSERRLDLYSGSTLVKSYRIALGNNPSGHKQRQGDGRTPEGRFYVCTRNAKDSAFHIFLGLSYPGLPDAQRAVTSNQITWREYQVINQRLASRGAPLWETNLGGWVGIHGGTEAAFARKKISQRGSQDWTAGCVALTDREIAELHAATQMGTPVDINP